MRTVWSRAFETIATKRMMIARGGDIARGTKSNGNNPGFMNERQRKKAQHHIIGVMEYQNIGVIWTYHVRGNKAAESNGNTFFGTTRTKTDILL